ncbi:homocitrate synthase/isopropylmalate synthase family protein [Aestuariispira insulae]|uniref:Homocitrate synthase n=1 Tax=Aestuariispira insulae TaxID=1461337 RepID=A0A3D9HUU6_9PROT|nr:homocitrate synthase [Aestuariispira insulae]RED53237.1 homocitrate synthase [Aestuariispira insulae]
MTVAPVDLSHLTLIDTTLREGEQFQTADFTSSDKRRIAEMLVGFGVNYLEVTNPAASERSFKDAEKLVSHLPRTKIAAHIRCHPEDVRIALDSGVGALHMVMAVSPILRSVSHGKGITEVIRTAEECAKLARSRAPGIELRYSNEDAFRCGREDLAKVYGSLAQSGLFDRFGLADTTGVASPMDVQQMVQWVREETGKAIEWHGHNDTGCADANAGTAALSGASHVNCSVLGIGERNGIASLESMIAFLYTRSPDHIRQHYHLDQLQDITRFVADCVGVEIPFSHPIMGKAAFSHKAGIHLKAVLQDPGSYEAIVPEEFGLERHLNLAHRLTGWNAIRVRSEALGLSLSVEQLKQATFEIKRLSDEQEIEVSDVDDILMNLDRINK